jgi:N-acetylneuraminic acid mutarotase
MNKSLCWAGALSATMLAVALAMAGCSSGGSGSGTPSATATLQPTAAPTSTATITSSATATQSPTPGPSPTSGPSPTPLAAAHGSILVVGQGGMAAVINPGSQVVAATGSLPAGIQNGAMVGLQDGRVLYTGGDQGGTALAHAWIWTPNAPSWVQIADMTTARTLHSATVLNDGRVLIAGGFSVIASTPPTAALNSAELFDPATDTFSAVAPMNTARAGHTATLLADNSVLVTGGATQNSTPTYLASGEVYDPASNSWTAVNNQMSVARGGHSASLLDNGEVLIAGTVLAYNGQGCGSTCAATDLYDPTTNSFVATGNLNTARYDQAASILANGQVLVTGGCCGNNGTPLSSAELYNPSQGSWSTTASLQVPRTGHAAVYLTDGRILIAGGASSASTEFYQQQTTLESFLSASSLPAIYANTLAVRLKPLASNQLSLGVGSNGYNFANGMAATLRVCAPNTTNCRRIRATLVDSGSTGVIVFASKLGGVSLPPVTDTTTGNTLGDCEQYVTSSVWGWVASADVYLGSQKITLPIHVLDDTGSFAPPPTACTTSGTFTNTPASFGGNGLVGINPYPDDSGLYYTCTAGSSGTCSAYSPSTSQMVSNPVAALPLDNNGSVVQVDALVQGNSQVAVYGMLTFGIGTASNNQPPSNLTLMQTNASGSIGVAFNGSSYPGLFDTGTSFTGFLTSKLSSLPLCQSGSPGQGLYCPANTATLSTTNSSFKSSIGTNSYGFQIGNASNLLSVPQGQPQNFALQTLGGPTGNFVDFGAPNFFGRPIYIALDNSTTVLGPGPYCAY